MTHEPRHIHSIRRTEGSGPWLHPTRPQPRSIGWHWIALVLAGSAIAGLGLALLLGGIEAYAAPPGMDICSTKGC